MNVLPQAVSNKTKFREKKRDEMQSHSSGRTRLLLRTLLLMLISGMLSSAALAQRTINEADRTILHGNVHPQARAEFDRGSANAAMPVNRMVLLLPVPPD